MCGRLRWLWGGWHSSVAREQRATTMDHSGGAISPLATTAPSDPFKRNLKVSPLDGAGRGRREQRQARAARYRRAMSDGDEAGSHEARAAARGYYHQPETGGTRSSVHLPRLTLRQAPAGDGGGDLGGPAVAASASDGHARSSGARLSRGKRHGKRPRRARYVKRRNKAWMDFATQSAYEVPPEVVKTIPPSVSAQAFARQLAAALPSPDGRLGRPSLVSLSPPRVVSPRGSRQGASKPQTRRRASQPSGVEGDRGEYDDFDGDDAVLFEYNPEGSPGSPEHQHRSPSSALSRSPGRRHARAHRLRAGGAPQVSVPAYMDPVEAIEIAIQERRRPAADSWRPLPFEPKERLCALAPPSVLPLPGPAQVYEQLYSRNKKFVANREKQRQAEEHAAVKIQAVGRGHIGREYAASKRRSVAATKIQAQMRGRVGRRRAEDARQRRNNAAATQIQKIARGKAAKSRVSDVRERRIVAERRTAATNIQKIERSRQARRRAADRREQITNDKAATKIQNQVRRKAAKRRVDGIRETNRRQAAATKVQSVARGRAARRKVAAMVDGDAEARAAIVIQRVARGMVDRALVEQMWEEEALRLEEEDAARDIQRIMRGYSARLEADKVRTDRDEVAAVLIQSAVRRKAAWNEVEKRRSLQRARDLKPTDKRSDRFVIRVDGTLYWILARTHWDSDRVPGYTELGIDLYCFHPMTCDHRIIKLTDHDLMQGLVLRAAGDALHASPPCPGDTNVVAALRRLADGWATAGYIRRLKRHLINIWERQPVKAAKRHEVEEALHSLSEKAMDDLANMVKKPSAVVGLAGVFCVLYDVDPTWKNFRRILLQPKFVEQLSVVDTSDITLEQFKVLKRLVEDVRVVDMAVKLTDLPAVPALARWVSWLYGKCLEEPPVRTGQPVLAGRSPTRKVAAKRKAMKRQATKEAAATEAGKARAAASEREEKARARSRPSAAEYPSPKRQDSGAGGAGGPGDAHDGGKRREGDPVLDDIPVESIQKLGAVEGRPSGQMVTVAAALCLTLDQKPTWTIAKKVLCHPRVKDLLAAATPNRVRLSNAQKVNRLVTRAQLVESARESGEASLLALALWCNHTANASIDYHRKETVLE